MVDLICVTLRDDLPLAAKRISNLYGDHMAMHELVIRGATVIDGLGRDLIRADVVVRENGDGRLPSTLASARKVNDPNGS